MSDSTVASRRLNALRRWRSPDDPAIDDARRDLAAASLSDHIRRVVDQAPPLTAEQIEQLRGLLPVPGPIDADLGNGESGRATPA